VCGRGILVFMVAGATRRAAPVRSRGRTPDRPTREARKTGFIASRCGRQARGRVAAMIRAAIASATDAIRAT
jgi:hypothetical protein